MTERRRVPLDEQGLPVRKEDVPAESGDAGSESGECTCPHLDAADWDGVESDWSDIAFVKAATSAVLGVPVGFDSAREDLRKKAERAGATVPDDAMLLIGSGRFRRPIMLEVEGAAPGAPGIEHPGGFGFTRLLPAPWGQLSKVVDLVEKEAVIRFGRNPDAMWVWYLTCRLCSRARNFETLILAHYRPRD